MLLIANKVFSILSLCVGIGLIIFVIGIQGQSMNEAVVLGLLLIFNGVIRLFFQKMDHFQIILRQVLL